MKGETAVSGELMELAVKETGKGKPETIVFLHGGGDSGWMWLQQTAYFKNYHCIVPDFAEHGQSIDVKPFTIRNSGLQIADIIRIRAASGRAHVVGFSLGAQVLVDMLSICPDVIDRAVVCSALVRPMKVTQIFIKPMVKLSFPLIKYRWFAKLNAKEIGITDDLFEHYYADSLKMSVLSLNTILHENMSFRLAEHYDSDYSNVLVVVGEKELSVMKKSAVDMARALPNSCLLMIPRASHKISYGSPETYNQILFNWINGLPVTSDT